MQISQGMKRLLFVLAELTVLLAFAVFSAFAEVSVTEEVVGMPSYYVECGILPTEKGRDHGASPVRRFDVSEDGKKVAICFGEDGKRTVLVLDGQAEVIYGYDVTLSGDIVPRWTDKGLTLYLASSRIAVVLGENGAFVEKLKYSETPEGEEAVKKLFYDGAQERTLADGTVYRLVGESIAPDGGAVYDRLIRVGADGKEDAFYAASVKPDWVRKIAPVGVSVAVLGLAGVAVAEICVRVTSRPKKDQEG